MPKHLGSDIEDIEDILFKIEKSYDIKFETNELSHIRTFGELCDHIILKLKQEQADDCTGQQAFYKLREVILTIKQLDKSKVQTDTLLSFIFPRHRRRKQIVEIESKLGFKIKALRAKYFVSGAVFAILFGSFIELFFNWKFGLAGLASSIILIKIVGKTAKEFTVKTIGELADKISQENYLKARRNPATVNRNEIVKKIEQMFIRDLALGKTVKEITPETIIVERRIKI